ncbi:DUF2188 domain-containing protein [Methylobacterium sp. CM6246]
MATAPTKKTGRQYKSIGQTYDGVRVLAPKTKSTNFTTAEIRAAVANALKDLQKTKTKKPLAASNAMRVVRRDDGQYAVMRPGAKRASAILPTQAQAVARARELDKKGAAPIAKRVRKSPAGKRRTWRET